VPSSHQSNGFAKLLGSCNKFLHQTTVQNIQEFRGAQLCGVLIYNKHPRLHCLWEGRCHRKSETFTENEWPFEDRTVKSVNCLSLIHISRPPTYDIVTGWKWQCLAICSSGSRRICDGSLTYSNWHKMRIELLQFSTILLVIWIELSYWSTSSHLLSSLWRDMLEERRSWRRLDFEESTGCEQCCKGKQIIASIILCLQSCDSQTRNISSGIMNFLSMI